MTKASKLIESLITILDRDVLGNICEIVHGDASPPNLCKGIQCNDCPFNESYSPESTQSLKDILKTVKTLELIDVDSREQDI